MKNNRKISKKHKGYIAMGSFLAAVILLSVFFPVLRIYGSTMSPTVTDGDVVVSMKTHRIHIGDILVFKYNGKNLIRRCIAESGDWINIDAEGNVFVNDIKISEQYIYRKTVGECDITFPFQVPRDTYFVMGDNRGVAIDSRIREIGCVEKESIDGKLLFRLFPIGKFSIN